MEIKKGQIWQNKNGTTFLIIATEAQDGNEQYCQVQLLQDNEYSYAGHILDNVDKIQFNNMKLVEEIVLNEKDVKIRKLQSEIEQWKSSIKYLQDKIHYNEQYIEKLGEHV